MSERTDPGPGSTATKVDSSTTKSVRDQPKRPGTRTSVRVRDADLDDAAAADPGPETPTPVSEADGTGETESSPDSTGPEPDSSTPERPAPELVKADRVERFLVRPVPKPVHGLREENSGVLTVEAPSETPEPAGSTPALAVVAAASSSAVEITTPSPPKPLSPIAQLLELPGRLVNAVLEVFDFTSYANSPSLPIGLGPINDLIFGAFREVERLLGLWQTPPVQPVIPTLTYTGPTTRPTPTVAQFLNASAAGYVLGSTPGGLVPFTVDGFQMSSTNIFSGMVGKAWVTPEGQVIIAYQGTTGGTNLLFNPLITITQIDRRPAGGLHGHHAAGVPRRPAIRQQRVQAEAALQGYTSDDIFVTGHSLGGWEAQFVAQQTGLAGIGFEAPGINTVVDGQRCRLEVRQRRDLRQLRAVHVHRSAWAATVHAALRARRGQQAALRSDRDDRRSRCR